MKPNRRYLLVQYRLVIFVACLIVYVTGCSQQPTQTIDPESLYSLDEDSFGKPPVIPSPAELLRLDARQQKEITQFFNDPENRDLPSDKKIHKYLTQDNYNFHYRSDTYTVAEAIQRREGNCLTMAMVSKTLAEMLDIDIEYQLVNSPPVFEREQDVISRGVHVRSFLLRPAREANRFFINSRGSIIDYFYSRDAHFVGNLSDNEIYSSYYNNIAVAHLENNQLNQAYWYSREALKFAPNYAPNINTMAVIYRRHGNWDQAEAIYRWAISTVSDQLTLLKNYRALLEHQGRKKEARRLSVKISKLKDTNPYLWLDLGNEAFELGNYKQSIKHYKKSIKHDPYLEYGYEGIAKAWYQLGKPQKSKDMWLSAKENSLDEEKQKMYQMKIDELNKLVGSESSKGK